MNDSAPLLELAVAIADGSSIDWPSVVDSASTDEERQLLRELQFIAGVAQTPGEWGPFRIIERVGGGTFGDVFRAWDTRLDREVALKLLRREHADGVRAGSTAMQEGRILARVRHPNVVTVYGAEAVDGQVGIVMEFVRGHTLAAELEREGPLSADRAIDVGLAVANAVAAVHATGLVHRDVKAQNVLRAHDGRIVLTDFGTGCDVMATSAGAPEIAGTPLYLAPEVLGGQPATSAADVYSIGVLLYHLVTRDFPVAGRTLEEVRRAHASGERKDLRARSLSLPVRFIDIVDRALDPNPATRLQTAAGLAAALTEGRVKPIARRLTLALAAALAGAIVVALSSLDSPSTSANPTANALYVKGRAFAAPHRGARDVRRAADLFEQAIAEDPGFAAAHAALAEAIALLSINYGGIAPNEALQGIEAAAEKAVALGPELPEAHTAMGIARTRRFAWAEAEAAFQKALALDRTRPQTYIAYAIACLFPQGDLDGAIRMLRTALRYDPVPTDVLRQLAWVQVNSGDYDEAIANAEKVLAVDRTDAHVKQVRARALFHQGSAAQAIAALAELGPGSRGFLGYAYAVTGRRSEAEAIAARDTAFPARQALVFAGLGDKDQAFGALERMISAGEPRAGIYLTHPEFSALHNDPRFARLRERVGVDRKPRRRHRIRSRRSSRVNGERNTSRSTQP